MKVFISWSGEHSKAVASALRDWLPSVIQSVHPWMSRTDIEAGARWLSEIGQELNDTRFGIICLTRDNQLAPWVLFEAGALAKTLADTFVCPYLIEMEPSDIRPGPLTQFQAKRANMDETRELVLTINRALGEGRLPEDSLSKAFDKWWPDLESVLVNLPEGSLPEKPSRAPEEMIEEVLEIVRGLARRVEPDLVTWGPEQRAMFSARQSRSHAIGYDPEPLNLDALTEENRAYSTVALDFTRHRELQLHYVLEEQRIYVDGVPTIGEPLFSNKSREVTLRVPSDHGSTRLYRIGLSDYKRLTTEIEGPDDDP